MKTLGHFIRERRVHHLDVSLREFCLKNNLDVGNWSKIERDMRAAPERGVLATFLEIQEGSAPWEEMCDLIASQKIQEILSDEEVLKRLPIALRTSHLLSDEQLEVLKKQLKRT